MGLFAKIKENLEAKQKQKAEEERIAREKAEEEKRLKEQKRKEEIIDNLGVVCTYKYIMAEEKLRKKYEASEYTSLGFKRYAQIMASSECGVTADNLPGLLLEEFLGMFEAKGDALDYVGPNELLVEELKVLLRNFVTDDNGEIQQCEPALSAKELLPIENNPLLNFAFNFDCFEFGDESDGPFKDKYDLYAEAMKFIVYCIILKKSDIIERNQWLFDRDTYLNDFDMIRKKSSFFQQIRKSCNDEFKAIIDDIDK